MDPAQATARRPASKRRARRRRQGQRQQAAAAAATPTGGGANVQAVQRESTSAATAPVTTAGAATPVTKGRNRRRSRRRRGRRAGAADEAAAASEKTAGPVSDAISSQEGSISAPQASYNLEAMAAHLSDSVLPTTTEKITNSDKIRKRSQGGNEALKVSVADAAACSSLARHEHSIRENEASRSKLFKRSDVRLPIDSCTAQGTDGANMDYHKMKSADLPRNLKVYYKGCRSLQKSEEYMENENVSSLNSTSLLIGKNRKKKRDRRRHNRCKKATSQDSPSPTAVDNSGLMTMLSENSTSGLKSEEQRKKQDQSKAPMTNLVLVIDAKRSEAYGVNLKGTIEKRCELGPDNLGNTLESRFELPKSNLDCTNMERNGLQEQYLAEEYMEKLKFVLSPVQYLVFPKKKLLILDLNGLLADINEDYHNAHMADAKVRGKLVFRRPYCDDFLNFCALNFELGIWSSRKKENVASVVDIIMREFKPRLLFCWDMTKCTFTGHKTLENKHKPLVLKELRKLWNVEEPDLPWEVGDYSPSNTLLVDDSPYKALRNPPHTAIFPHSYSYLNWNDNSLGPGGDLRVYLQNLAAADDVECFVRNNPFGQPFITQSDPHWNFYAQIAGKGRAPLTCCG